MQSHCKSGDTWAWHIILSSMHFAAVTKGHFQPGQKTPETVNLQFCVYIWPQNTSSEDKTDFFFLFLKAIFHKSLKIILSRVQKLSQIFVVWTRGISRSSSGFEGIATFTATGKASTGTAGTDSVKFFQWISWQGFNSLWAHHPWQRDVSLLILQLSTPGTECYSIYIQK